MAKVPAILRDEHRSIGAILQGMEYLLRQIRDRGVKVDLKVFWAMLYYLDTFSERVHHPKEDEYLFRRVRARTRDLDQVIGDLQSDHARGAQALKRLEQCLARYQEGGAREFPVFAREVEAFVRAYWEHMSREEEQVLPVAENVLSAADWAEIDSAFERNVDPLVAERESRDFRRLFARIVDMAPPPVGIGPAAGRRAAGSSRSKA
jgi:hemerythrin-like domain-containing protein